MNDVARLTRQPKVLSVDGVDYAVHPLSIDDFGVLQAWVDAQFPDPFDVALAAIERREALGKPFPVAQQKCLLEKASDLASVGRRLIGTPDADQKLTSVEGVKELLFVSIHKGDSTFARDQAEALHRLLSLGQIEAVFRHTEITAVIGDPKAGAMAGTATPS